MEYDQVWRSAVATVAASIGSVSCIAGVTDADTAFAAYHTYRPQIVVIEPRVLEGAAARLIAAVEAHAPPARIVFLAAKADDATLHQLRHPCVSGLVEKPRCDAESLRQSLAAAADNRRWLDESVRLAWQNLRQQPDAFFKILSAREVELLPRFGRAETDADIAAMTGLREATVRSHRESIMRKLGLNGRAKLMDWAMEKGFVSAKPVKYLRTEEKLKY